MEKGTQMKEKVAGFLKNKKSVEIIIAVVIILIIISIYISTLGSNTAQNEETSQTGSTLTNQEELEKRLENVLSAIEGAGDVKVMITYETTSEIVPAMDTQKQTTTSEGNDGTSSSQSQTESSKPVTIQQQSGAEPVVITEKQPKVRGAIVIAQGAGDVKVKMSLLKAAQTVLNISADKVDVFTMTNND